MNMWEINVYPSQEPPSVPASPATALTRPRQPPLQRMRLRIEAFQKANWDRVSAIGDFFDTEVSEGTNILLHMFCAHGGLERFERRNTPRAKRWQLLYLLPLGILFAPIAIPFHAVGMLLSALVGMDKIYDFSDIE